MSEACDFTSEKHPEYYIAIDTISGKLIRATTPESIATFMLGRDVLRVAVVKIGVGIVLIRCAEFTAIVDQLKAAR